MRTCHHSVAVVVYPPEAPCPMCVMLGQLDRKEAIICKQEVTIDLLTHELDAFRKEAVAK